MTWIPLPQLSWNPIDRPPTEAAFYHLRYRDGQIAVRYFDGNHWYIDKPSAQFRQLVATSPGQVWRELLEQPI